MAKIKTVPWRKLSLITLVVVLIVLVGSAGIWLKLKRPATSKYKGPVEHMNVGTILEYSALTLIAQENGYFEKNGLEVTTKEYDSGPTAVTDLLAGNVDVVTAADFVGVRNSFNNEDLKILAAQARTESFFLVVRPDHRVNKEADLKGKRIGVTRKTAGEFYFGQFLIFNQLSLNDVTIVDGTPSQLVDRLVKGDLDAVVTFNPNISNAESRLGNNVAVWSIQGNQLLSPLLYSTGKFTSQRPEVVKRYLKSLLMAEKFTKAHDQQARAIVAHRLKYDDAYMQLIWPKISFALTLDQSLLIDMENQARWAIDNHLTQATKVPNYLHIVYFPGLEAVKPEGITIIR